MKKLEFKTNVVAPDATDIYGALKDDAGAHDGTYADTEMMQDAMVFFEHLMSESGVVANGLNDNDVNGFQLYAAFKKIVRPYKVYSALITQTGTAAPTVTILGENDLGTIVWARTATGVYTGTLAAAFVASKTHVNINSYFNLGRAQIEKSTSSIVEIRSFNGAGSAADARLSEVSLEIRVYD